MTSALEPRHKPKPLITLILDHLAANATRLGDEVTNG